MIDAQYWQEPVEQRFSRRSIGLQFEARAHPFMTSPSVEETDVQVVFNLLTVACIFYIMNVITPSPRPLTDWDLIEKNIAKQFFKSFLILVAINSHPKIKDFYRDRCLGRSKLFP